MYIFTGLPPTIEGRTLSPAEWAEKVGYFFVAAAWGTPIIRYELWPLPDGHKYITYESSLNPLLPYSEVIRELDCVAIVPVDATFFNIRTAWKVWVEEYKLASDENPAFYGVKDV